MKRVLRFALVLAVVLLAVAHTAAQADPATTTPPTPTTANPAATTPNPVATTATTTPNGATPTTVPTVSRTTVPPGGTRTTVPTAAGAANASATTKPTRTSAAAAAAAAGATATEATAIDSSPVNVDPKSEYGTKSPISGGNSTNATTSGGNAASNIGSWLVPVIIAVVIVGALVFASFLKKQTPDDNERDLGGHRRATSYFEHPRTNKSQLSKHDDVDATPVLGNPNQGQNPPLSRTNSNQSQGQTQPQLQHVVSGIAISGSDMVKKQSSTILTASTASPRGNLDRRSSAQSDEVPAMLEASMQSFSNVLSPQSQSSSVSIGSSFKTPEPGTSVIL